VKYEILEQVTFVVVPPNSVKGHQSVAALEDDSLPAGLYTFDVAIDLIFGFYGTVQYLKAGVK
jgi:hypothetical protein